MALRASSEGGATPDWLPEAVREVNSIVGRIRASRQPELIPADEWRSYYELSQGGAAGRACRSAQDEGACILNRALSRLSGEVAYARDLRFALGVAEDDARARPGGHVCPPL